LVGHWGERSSGFWEVEQQSSSPTAAWQNEFRIITNKEIILAVLLMRGKNKKVPQHKCTPSIRGEPGADRGETKDGRNLCAGDEK